MTPEAHKCVEPQLVLPPSRATKFRFGGRRGRSEVATSQSSIGGRDTVVTAR